MKNILIPFLTAILLSISINSHSQAQLKIGHVDMNELLMALPERDSAQVILENESKELELVLEEMTVAYNKLLDDYQKGLSSYSDVIKKAKESEILDKQKRISEFEQNATVTLQNRNAELVRPIYDKINKAINKIATENSFTYILDLSKGSVVFTSKDSQNINPLVLKTLKP